jgi:DNA-binding Lrp family transcriptional regulator
MNSGNKKHYYIEQNSFYFYIVSLNRTLFTILGYFKMDSINIKLIERMQENADLSLLELSKSVGISKTACWNRLQRMDEENIILGKKILFNRNAIDLSIVVFLSISVGRHSLAWVDEFSKIIERFPEIIEAHRLTGEGADYQLKIICPSMEAYDNLQQKLISEIDFTAMSTKISLKEIKNEQSLPLSHLKLQGKPQ